MAKSASKGLEDVWDHVESESLHDQLEAPRQSERERHPTEKGSEYIRNIRLQAVTTTKRSWRKQINSIHSILVTRKDIATLTAGCEDLERKMTQFSLSHEELEAVIEDEEERKLMNDDFEVISRENNEILRTVNERIKSLERELKSNGSTTSRSTKTSKISDRSSHKSSHASSRNSSLSLRQKRVQLEGDIASLRATMALPKERQQKEEEHRARMDEVQRKKMEIAREEERTKEELKFLEENFRIKEELAHKEAQMIASMKQEQEDNYRLLDEFPSRPPMETCSKELLEKFLDDQSVTVSNVHISAPNQSPVTSTSWAPASPAPNLHPLNPFTPPLKPMYTLANSAHPNPFPDIQPRTFPYRVNQELPEYDFSKTVVRSSEAQVQSKLLEVAKLLAETQNQSRLPIPEPDVFSGDFLQYPVWLKAFETLIEARAVKPSERLHYLGKYVKGEAKQVVASFLLLGSEDAYEKVKEMLAKRFGDPFVVASSCRSRLESWPSIHPNDGPGLRRFADYLV